MAKKIDITKYLSPSLAKFNRDSIDYLRAKKTSRLLKLESLGYLKKLSEPDEYGLLFKDVYDECVQKDIWAEGCGYHDSAFDGELSWADLPDYNNTKIQSVLSELNEIGDSIRKAKMCS